MAAVPVSGGMTHDLKTRGVAGLYAMLEAAIMSLACQAQCAYPKRDYPTERLQLGLAPLLESKSLSALAAA